MNGGDESGGLAPGADDAAGAAAGASSAASAERGRPARPAGKWRRRAPAIVAAAGMLALWQAIVSGFGVPTYIAPSPVQVLQVFVEQGDILWINFWPTLMEAASGFLVGNSVAAVLAVWFVHSQLAERAFYPIAVFINTIPIIAVAPILVLLLGNGYAPKIVIAALICFFPTLVNMVRGLKAVSPQMLELMRVLSASGREVLFKIRLQSSLPFLFAALKIASHHLRHRGHRRRVDRLELRPRLPHHRGHLQLPGAAPLRHRHPRGGDGGHRVRHRHPRRAPGAQVEAPGGVLTLDRGRPGNERRPPGSAGMLPAWTPGDVRPAAGWKPALARK